MDRVPGSSVCQKPPHWPMSLRLTINLRSSHALIDAQDDIDAENDTSDEEDDIDLD